MGKCTKKKPLCSSSHEKCGDVSEGYTCNRVKNHSGSHVACGGTYRGLWDEEPNLHNFKTWKKS